MLSLHGPGASWSASAGYSASMLTEGAKLNNPSKFNLIENKHLHSCFDKGCSFYIFCYVEISLGEFNIMPRAVIDFNLLNCIHCVSDNGCSLERWYTIISQDHVSLSRG